MTTSQLKEKLSSVIDLDGIGINIYFLLKMNEETVLKRANIIDDVKGDLLESYLETIQEIVQNDDLGVINISAADDRRNAIYQYDLDNKPSFFEYFDHVSEEQDEANPNYFQFDDDDLANLEGYFVHLGDYENNIIIYRKQIPVNLFKRGKIYLIKGDATQFVNIDKEFLRIDSKIDVIHVDEEEFVYNISILERHYEFREIIQREAESSLENIEGLNILENIDVLRERIDDTAFARKLSRISTASPVFTLPNQTILSFVQNHEILSNEFRYNDDDSKIMLDTKKSQNYFLKLMNDDFLHSELTDYDYMTPAKDRLQAE